MQVSPFYDPMISKLIVRGPDRAGALRKLDLALSQYEARPWPVPLPFAMGGIVAFRARIACCAHVRLGRMLHALPETRSRARVRRRSRAAWRVCAFVGACSAA